MKVIIPVLLLLTMPVQAEVYKTITPDGEVIYSDVRTNGAKQLNVPKPQTYTPPPLPVSVQQPAVEEDESGIYTSFVIDSPVNEETVRDNLGNVELLVTLEPALIAKNGHRIEYYLDGEPHGRPTVDTRKTFTSLDRGEHQLSAAVVDDKGTAIIRTQPVTVYLHRPSTQQVNSLLNPDNPNSPKHPDHPQNPANPNSTLHSANRPPAR
jgi:hypothetical protein